MAGLAIGVSSMKSGERALLHIGWELGYGNFFSKTDRRKMDGNNLFKEDKLEEAMQQYEMAIAYMGDDFMFQLYGKYQDMALAVKNPCHLNMAACSIKLKRR
ncbi:unnamed protein product [Brassica oleracea var. botrytis]|uniref:BnaC03g27660D protein n=4 Tax=Brassica TaxID=3705 RepID=A0A078H9A8_BRANA|nr:hypothetical protein HID58_052715 [Brassica napus]CAF1701934.1 unnamed protein product [Brassica napus]CDY34049.1 BnaC03g27660D [Brassica napus]VDC91082.1 unnamed protein product [Brassica oleracea]